MALHTTGETPSILLPMSIVTVFAFLLAVWIRKAGLDLPNSVPGSLVCAEELFLFFVVLIVAFKSKSAVELEFTGLRVELVAFGARVRPLFEFPIFSFFLRNKRVIVMASAVIII